MGDSQNHGTVTIPAAEYESLKSDGLRYYGQAESAGREVAAIKAERDHEAIARVVRTAAEGAGARPESIVDVITMLTPGLRVEGGEVRVKGSPDVGVADPVNKFLKARPHWAQSSGTWSAATTPKSLAPGANVGFATGVPMPGVPKFDRSAESLTYMARALAYPGGRAPGGSR